MNELFQGMEYVYAVYKEKGFSAAAKKLFVSQPSLSAAVKRVEDKIGYPIFDRSTKPLTLTECGRGYIRSVEQIMAVQNDFSRFLDDWGALKTGSLTIGGSSLYASQILPSLIHTFSQKYPGIQVSLVEGSSQKLQSMLAEGDLDLLIDSSVLDPDTYDSLTIKEERLFLAVPVKFDINKKLAAYRISAEQIAGGKEEWILHRPVPLKLLRNEPFVFLNAENDTGRRAAALCHQAGFSPNVLFTLDQQLTAYQITKSGLALSILSDTLISKMDESERVVYYCVDPSASCRRLRLFWKRARYTSHAISEFLKMASPQK